MILKKKMLAVISLGSLVVLLAWAPLATAYPVPVGPQFGGGGINFDSETCCISYDATTDRIIALSSGPMSIFNSAISFDGTWILDANINEQFQVTDSGSVSLFGDLGSGLEQLISGAVSDIGFILNFTERDEGGLFYGVALMQIVFEIDAASDLMTSIFGTSGQFVTGFEIGDSGFYRPGERNDSPFAQDFRCGTSAFRCQQFEGSYGLNNLVSVAEPGTLALLAIGLFGMGLSRRRRKV